jgi:hypothetical protein
MLMWSELVDITQCPVVIPVIIDVSGTTYLSHPQGVQAHFLNLEDGTNTLSRNVDQVLPLDTA